ncbi:MAG: hypothetical protein LUD14_03240 [Clostridiales bacterium]|nr:hypothetical protein [Clostridiales bacterium]
MKNQIPDEFKHCFWDTKWDELDINDNKDFIITRLYTHEGMPGIRWVTQQFTDDEIKEAAKHRRALNPIVANYLQKKYHIERSEMAYYRVKNEAGKEWTY